MTLAPPSTRDRAEPAQGRTTDDAAVKVSALRRLETAAAWTAAAVAWGAYVLGSLGPHLGGVDPGLPGRVGFAIEVVAAMWTQGGMLAAVAAVAAAFRRRWWPAAAIGAVAVAILLPDLWDLWGRARSPATLRADGIEVVRIATVNLAEQNEHDPLMIESLRRLDADVLVLPEFTTSWGSRLEGWLRAHYPYGWIAVPPLPDDAAYHVDGFRIAVWSRLPPAGEHEAVHLGGVVSQIRVPLRFQGRIFALYGIHPRKGFPASFHRGAWRDRRDLLAWFARERLPMVVAGDFNATPRSAFFVRLRQLGLENASQAVLGSAPVTWPTYPVSRAPFRVAIDHVVHSEAFAAVGFERGMTTASDHVPVVAELVWRP